MKDVGYAALWLVAVGEVCDLTAAAFSSDCEVAGDRVRVGVDTCILSDKDAPEVIDSIEFDEKGIEEVVELSRSFDEGGMDDVL